MKPEWPRRDFRPSPPGGSPVGVLDADLMSDRAEDTGQLRFLVRKDIPALVALRQRVFRRTERSSPAELAAYFERVFFESPLGGTVAHQSLVYEDAAGRITGFLGVIPRRMFLGNRAISVAVATQLMVAPDAPGLVGRRLARALVDGPQDLVLADTANEAARRLWDTVGGHTAVAYSLCWYRALSPVRFALTRAAGGRLTRAAVIVLRPLLAVVDFFASRSLAAPSIEAGDTVEDLDVDRDLPEMQAALARWELRPGYTPEMLRWILEQVELKATYGSLRARVVRDARGRLAGWFLYCGGPGRVAQVLQVGARKHDFQRTLAHLFADARSLDIVGMVGRLEPLAAGDLSAAGARFMHEGPWMLVHARDGSLTSVIEAGRAFVSRLDGEWWLAF